MGRYDVIHAELADAAARRSDHSCFLRPHVFVNTSSSTVFVNCFLRPHVREQNANPNAKPAANADQKCQTDAWIRR